MRLCKAWRVELENAGAARRRRPTPISLSDYLSLLAAGAAGVTGEAQEGAPQYG